MFYDAERIVRKQKRYEKLEAYGVISTLETKGFSVSEMIDAVDILLTDDNNETRQAILERAKHILETRKEFDEKETSGNNDDSISDRVELTASNLTSVELSERGL